jgi:hypothetical protein
LPTQEDENNKRLAFELGSQLVKSYATGRDLPREVKSSMLKRGGKAYPLSEKTVEPFKLKEAEFNSFVTSLENTADVKEKMLHHLLSDNSEQKDYDSLKRAYLASIANTKFVSEVLVFESSSSVAPNSPELPEVDYNEDDSSPETTKVENVTDRESPLYDLAAENLEADPNSPKTPEVEDPLYDLAASIITTNPEEVGVGVVGVVVETYYDLGNNPTTNITITEAEAAPANQDDASSIAQSAWQEQELKTLGDACLGKIQLPTKEDENNKRLARELGLILTQNMLVQIFPMKQNHQC